MLPDLVCNLRQHYKKQGFFLCDSPISNCHRIKVNILAPYVIKPGNSIQIRNNMDISLFINHLLTQSTELAFCGFTTELNWIRLNQAGWKLWLILPYLVNKIGHNGFDCSFS